MVTVTISNDPSTLGPNATDTDIADYRAALQSHLNERFSQDVRVVTASVPATRCDDNKGPITQYLDEFESGNDWTKLL